jgi:hypothetical protein
VSGSVLSREEYMLAWTDPDTPLDTRRLSKSSAESEDLHGARNVHLVQTACGVRVFALWRRLAQPPFASPGT